MTSQREEACSFNSTLLEKTRRLLKERPKQITLSLIAEETGLKQDWIESLIYHKKRDSIDPGIKRIETLYSYLTKEPFIVIPKPIDATLEAE